ncbi:MAG: hypothetical protein AB7P18_26285 [Candidatus Binatia bacterium]
MITKQFSNDLPANKPVERARRGWRAAASALPTATIDAPHTGGVRP